MKVAYLGPAGTFTEDALHEAAGSAEFESLRTPTVHDAILAVERGEAERAFVPFENSIEGSVRSTLDTLALETEAVTIVGEHDFAVRAQPDRPRGGRARARSRRSSPTPSRLPSARASCASSCPASNGGASPAPRRRCGWSASRRGPGRRSGRASAAELYGCVILREGIQDEADNVTRFVWIAPRRDRGRRAAGAWKTSLVFSELGEDHPGALVEALQRVLEPRGQPTRGSSRGRCAAGSGRYMFFCDLEGGEDDAASPRRSRRSGPRPNRCGSSAPIPSAERETQVPAGVRRIRERYGARLGLNATYEPINVCTLRRAAVLLLKEKAELLERREGAIHSEHMTMERPDVIRLVNYVRIPREAHRRKITRRAVLARDSWTCQYCGSRKSGLTVDHVIPRSRGGKSVWENIVAACATCNRRKGNRLPREIHMHPRNRRRRRGRRSSSRWRARRSRPPGSSTYRAAA